MSEPEPAERSEAKPLIVGAGFVVVLAMIVGLLVATGDDGQQVATAGPTSARPATAGPTTSATAPSSVPSGESGLIALPDGDLARARLALIGASREGADEEVVLVTFEGVELGRVPVGDWSLYNPDRGVALNSRPGGWVVTEASSAADPVPGCEAVHRAGDLRVAVCGPVPEIDEIRLLAEDGASRVLSGPADGYGGHWRWALPSPDGRFLLAQWSGECEVPVAYLVEVATGERRPVVGAGVESMGIGWGPDGRAVVGLWPGYCGEADGPGMYLVDPVSRARQRIHRYHQGALVTP